MSELTPEREAELRALIVKLEQATDNEAKAKVCIAMNTATYGLEEHPEWWCHSCACDTCLSYGD